MSYDFTVHTAPGPDAETLRRLVTADPALSVVGEGERLLSVQRESVRGPVPAFEVRGPFPVEPLEVPPEVTALALRLRAVTTVAVPAASSGGVRAAEEFCRRLADAAGGVVVDRQRGPAGTDRTGVPEGTGEVVWPPESRRRYGAPGADALDTGTVDVVRVDWLLRAADAPERLPEVWLDLTRRLLPEAGPVGFGPTGPTGHTGPHIGRVDRDGEAAFARAWRAGPRRLGWSARLPVLDGEVATGGPVTTVSLTLLRDAVAEPGWREALLDLLPAVAEAAGAFYAQAQVLRGWTWGASGAEVGPGGERPDDLAPDGHWLGLPPEPVWCTWFGDPYREPVRAALTGGGTRETGAGLLHLLAPEPVDRARVEAGRPQPTWWQRLGLRLRLTTRTWLPAELTAPRAGGTSGPLRPARVRPPGLALEEDAAGPAVAGGPPVGVRPH